MSSSSIIHPEWLGDNCAVCSALSFCNNYPCRHKQFEASKDVGYMQRVLDDWKRAGYHEFKDARVNRAQKELDALKNRTNEQKTKDDEIIQWQRDQVAKFADWQCKCQIDVTICSCRNNSNEEEQPKWIPFPPGHNSACRHYCKCD
jgi:hypothetical protein